MTEQPPTLPDPDQMAAAMAGLIPESERETAGLLFGALLSVLAEGRATSMEELSALTGHPADQIPAWFPDGGGAEWDVDGRLVGQGMTLNPTPHQVEVDGHALYAWCAADALGAMPAIGRSVEISSPCHATGRMVTVTARPEGVQEVQPADAVVSVVVVGGSPDDPRGTMCNFGHFFASADAASDWLERHPDATLLSVPDAFRYALRTMQLLLHP